MLHLIPHEWKATAVRTLCFDSRSDAIVHLRNADTVMARIVDDVGPYELELRDDRFFALARSIVGQQLSVSAARTIWDRFSQLAGAIEPRAVVAIDERDLRACGLSRAKASYVQDLARRVLDGEVDLGRLDGLADDEVIRELTKIRGIGRWTAEMFLIFSLGRPDVFALDDVGLQRSVRLAYRNEAEHDAETLTNIASAWQPYRSVASLYLWEALDRGLLT